MSSMPPFMVVSGMVYHLLKYGFGVHFVSKGEGEIYIKASVQSINKTYNLKDYYLDDDCSTDKVSSHFGSPIELRGNSNPSITYNSNGYYVFSGGAGESGIPILALNGVTDVELSFELFKQSSGNYYGFRVGKDSNDFVGTVGTADKTFNGGSINGNYSESQYNNYNHNNKWIKWIVTVQNGELTIVGYENNVEVFRYPTKTLSSTILNDIHYMFVNVNNTRYYIKNILAKPL